MQDKIRLLLPPAHSDQDWARGVMNKNVQAVLDAICCEGRAAEGDNMDDAEAAVLTAQSLSEIAAHILGSELDESTYLRLKKCTDCVAMKFSLAHEWVGCEPIDRGLPDCNKARAV